MRIDKEGRDVTDMPGLHDESDTVIPDKPEWAQWQPDIFIQTLPGIPYMMPQEALPARDCANCLFHQEDWRGDGFCYMFRIEPTGDKCGQFKSLEVNAVR